MRHLISIFISIVLFFGLNPNVYAQPGGEVSIGRISPMEQGEKAPFDGVLLDAPAAAKLIVDQEEAEAKCQIEIDKEVEKVRAKLTLDLENMKAAKEAAERERDMRLALKEDHINFLEKEVENNARKAKNAKWWLIGGVAAGIALSVAGAFVIREIRPDQPIVVNTTSGN